MGISIPGYNTNSGYKISYGYQYTWISTIDVIIIIPGYKLWISVYLEINHGYQYTWILTMDISIPGYKL